jgi:hypothetical protein
MVHFNIIYLLDFLEELTSFIILCSLEKSNAESFEISLLGTAIGPNFVPLALGFSGQMSPQKYYFFFQLS